MKTSVTDPFRSAALVIVDAEPGSTTSGLSERMTSMSLKGLANALPSAKDPPDGIFTLNDNVWKNSGSDRKSLATPPGGMFGVAPSMRSHVPTPTAGVPKE